MALGGQRSSHISTEKKHQGQTGTPQKVQGHKVILSAESPF